MATKRLPQPEDFDDAPSADLTIRQQVNRSNLPLQTKAAILTALEKPKTRSKEKSAVCRAVEARVSDARDLTNTSLEELERVVNDALHARLTKISHVKVYRNGKIWKVTPKVFREPDHITRLKVVELFMKPQRSNSGRPKKNSRAADNGGTAGRLRDREESLEPSILDGNGNGQ
jgi:hypothetical protein